MSTDSKSQETESKLKAFQIFNIAEKPVMEFLALFLDEPHETIFRDELPIASDPLILLPLADYKPDTYIKFTIKPINLADVSSESVSNDTVSNDTVSNDSSNSISNDSIRCGVINNIIEHQLVKNGVGFLWYCVKEVFASIIASSMINNKPLQNITIELNEQNWTLYPKYLCDLSHKKNFLEQAVIKLTNITENRDKFDGDIADVEKNLQSAMLELTNVNNQITPEVLAEEIKINNSYSSQIVLAIFTEEIFEKDLPKRVEPPNFNTKDEPPNFNTKNKPPNFNNKDNVNAGHITTDNQNSDEKNKSLNFNNKNESLNFNNKNESPNFNTKDEPSNFNEKNKEYNLEERVSQLFVD
jgi:hypothetical protein